MSKWLHFLGKTYYPTPETFIKEAQHLGVNRRVALNTLGAFSWGDQVFLGFGDFLTKTRKTPPNPSFCFGFFRVSGVGGLPREILDELPKDAYREILESGGTQISRGCGGYRVLGRILGLTWTLQELAEWLREKFPEAKPSLMGEFREIPRTAIQKSFHWGYSRILSGSEDWEALKPYFTDPDVVEEESVAEIVSNYQLRFWESTGMTPPKRETPSLRLFPHQHEGVEFLRARSRALLADEMGLGKTVQALFALNGHSPSLVICPASVMGVWESEARRCAPEMKVQVLRGTLKERSQQLHDVKADLVIVNYEVVSRLLPELQSISWDTLILDEAHRIKNRKAQVTKAVRSLSRSIPRRYLLTGTPILNRPDDLWSLLNILKPEAYPSYWEFVDKFCSVEWNGFGWEVVGSKNSGELAQEMKDIYLRREKKEVLPDLPEKLTSKVWVDLDDDQAQEYSRMRRELTALLDSGERITSPTALSQLTRLRQICVDRGILSDDNEEPLRGAKAQALVELLEGREGKMVVFSQWSRVVSATSRLLTSLGIPHLVLTGETPQKERAKIVEEFQTSSQVPVFLTTIGAGGVGITLTAADTAVFLDKSWTPALNAQAVDRLHRIGQKSTVWVYEILARGTVEERVEKLLSRKEGWAEEVLGQELLQARLF
jgi:SNF2 family DNA or RNA helicase